MMRKSIISSGDIVLTRYITATVVGERVEISVFDDDHVEVSRFFGNEDVLDEDVLDEILNGDG